MFNNIIDRVVKKLKGWKEQTLSKVGKEVLLKAVTQAILTYMMSVFLFPKEIYEWIDSLMARFWWGQKKDERCTHCASWKKLCKRKKEGFLGFRDIWAFNDAMLAK